MKAIPLELITLIGSSLFGGFLKIWFLNAASRRQERLYSLQALTVRGDLIREARRYENPGFQWTRRIIALMATFFIIAFPKLVSVFCPETAIHYGYPELAGGFWFFSADVEKIQWVSHQGLVITPLDTHLLSAIVGLYFGSSLK